MKIVENKTAFILSSIITLLAAVASSGGLLMKNVYNDNDFVKMAWHTNDIITLFVDIYLPNWLAKWNKLIYTTLFILIICGLIYRILY